MDYENRFQELEDSDNPFTTVVMVFLLSQGTSKLKNIQKFHTTILSLLHCSVPRQLLLPRGDAARTSRGTARAHWLLCASVVPFFG
ncbi:MAG: hypothetical protein V7K17_14835 [Nostoc sp.]